MTANRVTRTLARLWSHSRAVKTLAGAVGALPSGVILFVVVLLLFAVLVPEFLSARNLSNILLAASPLAILALGMTLVMLTNGIDLSVGSCISFISVLTAALLGSGQPVLLSLLWVILAAVTIGAVNGLIVAYMGIPAFIVTLGTMGIAAGLALVIGNGQTLYWEKNWFNSVALSYLIGVPLAFWLVLILFAIVLWIVHQTVFGRHVYGIGCNQEALRLCGIHIARTKIGVYCLNGVFVGIAGLLITSRIASGNPNIGVGWEFEAVAAAAIGGVTFAGGRGHPAFAMVSAVTITMLLNGLGLLGIWTSIQYVFVGAILIVGMALNILLEKVSTLRSPAQRARP